MNFFQNIFFFYIEYICCKCFLFFLFLKGIYTGVVKRLFPYHVYPNQSVLKEALKSYLEEKLPDFMRSMSSNQFTNRFHGEWCSAVRY